MLIGLFRGSYTELNENRQERADKSLAAYMQPNVQGGRKAEIRWQLWLSEGWSRSGGDCFGDGFVADGDGV